MLTAETDPQDFPPPIVGEDTETVEVPIKYLENANWYYEAYYIEKERADELSEHSAVLEGRYEELNNVLVDYTARYESLQKEVRGLRSYAFGASITCSVLVVVSLAITYGYITGQ